MDIILLAVLLTGLAGLRLRKSSNHLSPEQTGAINGFFVLLVFLRHTVDYVDLGAGDGFFRMFNQHLEQLLVAPFLFYSGYGVCCSIQKKGQRYVNQLPRNRFFKVWLHFALAVLLYHGLAIYLGKDYSAQRIILSYTGWESIGNSNWYIFATLFMYLATWLSFKLFQKSNFLAAAALTALAVGYIFVVRQFRGLWWYDTALVYPAGVLYALYGSKLEKRLGKKLRPAAFLVMVGCFVACYLLRQELIWRELMAVAFALTIVFGTIIFQVGNPVLKFLGKYTFEIYILQRLPMILLQGQFSNRYVYLGVSFAATVLLAVVFKALLDLLDKLIFK